MKSILIMGIETSCDETSCSVVENGRKVLSNVISSQIDTHAEYGGVVPEIASRLHVSLILPVIDKALKDAGIKIDDLSAIGVTYGPGLVGALLVGISAAKGICYAKGLPLVGVNHIEGHISANYIANPDLEPPFICLVASGGHSHIIKVDNYGRYTVLGRTRDDAAGEAFDKVARSLGLGYPGGPAIEKAAINGDPYAVYMPKPAFAGGSLDFSFSGIKTSVLNLLNKLNLQKIRVPHEDIAAAFQKTVVDILVENTIKAALSEGIKRLTLAGGVSANSLLRSSFRTAAGDKGLSVSFPDIIYCTDNAAMIASAAYYRYIRGEAAGYDLNADPSLTCG